MVETMEDDRALLVESLPGSIDDLRPLGRELALEPGAAVWGEGDSGDEVVIVLEGRLSVSRRAADGGEIAQQQLYPGALAAEVAELDERARFTTVRAASPSRVLLVGAEAFRAFLRERTDVLEQLFWLQVRRARNPAPAAPHRVLTDPLTGLYHKGFFCERLSLELERARLAGDTLIVALFDVDRLGAFEKAHGPEAAEQVVRRLAELLRKMGRRGDVAARFGEDEFVTLLYGATASDGWRFAETYRGAIMATGEAGSPGPPRRVTISGGISGYPLDGPDEAALVEAARARLARAKQAGGNCIVGAVARSR